MLGSIKSLNILKEFIREMEYNPDYCKTRYTMYRSLVSQNIKRVKNNIDWFKSQNIDMKNFSQTDMSLYEYLLSIKNKFNL